METGNSFIDVIKNKGFLNLWVNQILVQLPLNSLNFALIIWVFRLTNSSFALSALMFAVYLPSLLLGLFSGVLVDITDRKKIILVIDSLLAVLFFSLVFVKGSYFAILVVTFIFNSLATLYAPAEASAIPIIVKRHQFITANSIFSMTLYVCFLLGFGLAGPLLENFDIDFIFVFGGILATIAVTLATFFPSIIGQTDKQARKLVLALTNKDFMTAKTIGLKEVSETIKFVRNKLELVTAILILAMIQVIIAMIAVLMPSFFEHVLHIQATSASYVLIIPLGLGMISGGLLMGRIGHKFPKRTIITWAVCGIGLLFTLIGISPVISPVVRYFPKHRPLPFTYQPSISSILALGAFLGGLLVVSIIVTSQTVVQEYTPEEDRGKVFALLGAVTAFLTLIPVLLTGALADLLGAQFVFLLIGAVIALTGIFSAKPSIFFNEEQLSFKLREFLGLGHWQKDA